ncbi:MAG: GMC family oxidoreductase N-terminal domain-containing protein [Aureliella sp.]
MSKPQRSSQGADHSEPTTQCAASKPARNIDRRRALKASAAVAIAAVAAPESAPAAPANLGKVMGRRTTGDSVFKQRAIQDYQHNMAQFGGRMSAPSERLLQTYPRGVSWQFDVLIIGSGYGASISAARIAQRLKPGYRLGVLERGREWIPGTFPDRLPDLLEASRLDLIGRNKGTLRNPVGLFNINQSEEITTLSGSGLGGSSLINANVAYRPDSDVFTQAVWPVSLRDRAYLEPYFDRAEAELGVAREPSDHTYKMVAQRKAWEYLRDSGASYEAANLTLTRAASCQLPVLNRQGMVQRACIDCGDCLAGCNVGAKNTLAQNYLPMARRAGAEFFTQTEVHRIEKIDGYYRVYFTHYADDGEGDFQSCHGSTTARLLILGAGSLGSSEILMRSNSATLQLTRRLGCGWTGNGDALGFIRKSQYPTGIGGFSAYPSDRAKVGPTIQTNLTYPNRSLAGRVLIQEGAVSRAYANSLGILKRDLDLDQTLVLLGMGHDGANGTMYLNESGYAKITWPDLLQSDYRKLIRSEFARVAEALGGKYEYLKIFGNRMISVHPLGGCGMSDDPAYGVVNHKGQVFDAQFGGDVDAGTVQARVHAGLYVIDGAMLPTSIACNPLSTISALAERCSDYLIVEPQHADLFAA